MPISPEQEFARVSETVRVLSLKLTRLRAMTGQLSQNELTTELSAVFEGIELGIPIRLPRALEVGDTERISTEEWKHLLSSLQDWNGTLNKPLLSEPELEIAALGLLWSRILLDEYFRRRKQEP